MYRKRCSAVGWHTVLHCNILKKHEEVMQSERPTYFRGCRVQQLEIFPEAVARDAYSPGSATSKDADARHCWGCGERTGRAARLWRAPAFRLL
jgi:hypothetical protein